MNKYKTAPRAEQQKVQPAPQFQVRSGMTAGASVEACLENLYYWQNQYYKKCGGAKPMPYTQ